MARTITVTFSDGTTHKYEGVPDAVTPDQVIARAGQDFGGLQVTALDSGRGAAPKPKTREQLIAENPGEYDPASPEYQAKYGNGSEMDQVSQVRSGMLKSAGDTALTLGSSLVSTPIAGLTGLVTAPLGLLGGDWEGVGARNVGRVQEALTWRPRSDEGQESMRLISAPFEKLAGAGDAAGQVVSDATGSPALGAAINTAVQSIPALLTRRGGVLSRTEVGPRGVTTAPKATATAPPPASTPNPAQIAHAHVTGALGLDWDALSAGVKTQLTNIAREAGNLDGLDQAALARELRLQSLPAPVPATRGQLLRDPVALRNEGNVAATAAGQPIRDVHLAQNQALLDNLDILRGRVSGRGKTAATATTPEQAGANLQGAARGKLELQKAKVDALYEKADAAGETAQTVDVTAIEQLLGDAADSPHYGYAQGWLAKNLKQAPPKGLDAAGKPIPATELSIRALEKLRKRAVAKAMNGGEDVHYAGELIKAIDLATDGAGGKLYAEARAARRAQGTEFQEQGAVGKLVDNASRTDRTTALENTTRTITNGSLEDIRKVKTTLLTGGDAATRTAGRAAWRDLRSQVVQDIKNDATKGVALNPDGSPNITAAGLKRAIDRYGPEKLNEIFGPGTAKQLNKILEATREVKTQPPNQIAGSSTLANALAFLEKGLTKIPGGGTVADVARGAAKIKDIGAGERQAQQATVTPLREVADQATARGKRRNVLGTREQLDPTLIPISQLGRQPQQ